MEMLLPKLFEGQHKHKVVRTRVPLQPCAQDAAPRPPPRRITDECRACRRRRHAAAALEAPNPSPFRRALRGAQRHDRAGSRVGRAWPGAARRAGRRRLRPRVFQHWTAPVAGITAGRRGGLRPGGRGEVRRCPQTPGCNILTKPSANIRAELRPSCSTRGVETGWQRSRHSVKPWNVCQGCQVSGGHHAPGGAACEVASCWGRGAPPCCQIGASCGAAARSPARGSGVGAMAARAPGALSKQRLVQAYIQPFGISVFFFNP